ncbi:MAG: carboxypeptidase regulatory-like domain-containing protein [Candidatus Saganbacteria bacterium]|nr:carboxypeptidase regulatory-like domain-containing protein [Candidatus Saganbacteria bacterium]
MSLNFRLLAVLCLLSVVLLPGCGDLSGEIGSIIVTPAPVTVGINRAQLFTALGRDSSGKLVNITPTWSVRGAIGTINALTGLFTAASAEGTGTVEAASGDLTGTSAVTITVKGWLTGNVKDTNSGLVVGIRVYLKQLAVLGDETDSSGNYTISEIPAGTYEAAIDSRGSTAGGTAEVVILQGQTTTQNFTLYTPTTVTTSTTSLF